ncbi:MAG: hypothetical protein R2792_00855 [Saprospiraceae bacterium]
MKFTNKIFQAICALPASSNRRLIRFLESPYFNQSKLLLDLCKLLLEYKNQDEEGFDRAALWDQLQPGVAYDDVNFRKYCSELLKLVEEFMAVENLQEHPEKKANHLLEYLVDHKVSPLYKSAIRKTRQRLQVKGYRTADYFYQSYLLERLYYKMKDFDVKLNVRANLEEISGNLDFFYWLEKLKFYNAVLSQRKTGTQEYELHFIDEIIGFLKGFPLEESPELALHVYTFLSLTDEENPEHYYAFREVLASQLDQMPPEEAVEFIDSAMHYCVGRINKGDREFLTEYFGLLDDGIEKGVFISNGELAPWRYNNAVAAALGLGKIDWAEQFIQQNKVHLPPATRENTYAFNLARVYRFQGRFKDVLELLRDLEYEDIGYSLLSKRMVVMTYYDLDELDALESFIESFRVFLNRHKDIPSQRRKSYLKWLKYVRQLTRLVPNDREKRNQLRQEILDKKAVIGNAEWLLEKLDELER